MRRKKRAAGGGCLVRSLTVLAVLAAVGVLVWTIIIRNVAPEITVEAGNTVESGDFLLRSLGLEAELKQELPDLTVPGDYTVVLRYCGMEYESILRVRDRVAPTGRVQELTAEGMIPAPEDFVLEIQDATQVQVSYETPPDPGINGIQEVVILLTDLGGNVTRLTTRLHLTVDLTPPQITGVTDRQVSVNPEKGFPEDLEQRLCHGVHGSDDMDPAPELTLDTSALKPAAGSYPVSYTLRNATGLATTVVAYVTVVEDTTPPEVLGVRHLDAYAGGTVAYRANVLVRDETDEVPALRVDSSQVDLSKPGEYPLTYIATDAAGNQTTVETTITVAEKEETYVEESEILREADEVLARFITPEMTIREKINAVYDWAEDHYRYETHMDKTNWMQAAHQMMTYGGGDCFGFYSFARLMFQRMGIPNLTLQRQPGYFLGTTHYWNMVSLDDGETWYHFDCCPRPPDPPIVRICISTDAELEKYQKWYPDYYNHDKSIYPATPEE